MLLHNVDAKYQRKRNTEDPEQVGSKEKGCANTNIATAPRRRDEAITP